MGNDLFGALLHVVRWQLVVLVGDEGLEIAPGLAGYQPQCHGLLHTASERLGLTEGPTRPVRGQRRQQPEHAKGQHQGPGGGGTEQGHGACAHPQHHSRRHQPIKSHAGEAW
ncbi:hypothetical protein D3C80_626640 [compost metagenome]